MDDPAPHLFDGKKALRLSYERLASGAAPLGTDVEIAPNKANASVRRRKQFALIQPRTRTPNDLGTILTVLSQSLNMGLLPLSWYKFLPDAIFHDRVSLSTPL